MSIKVKLALASAVIVAGISIPQNVNADESNNRLPIYTVDTEFKVSEQEHVKGTDNQLKEVDENTMKFIKDIAFDAYLSGNEYGIYPSIIIAQAVLESSSGKSDLSKHPNNNLFGVKGFYEGESVQMKTREDDGSGKLFFIYANFKKYPDKGASLRDHSQLLREGLNGYYYGAWRENAKTPEEAAEFLQGRYATDTKYASKLMKIIKNYNLERFDNPLSDRDLAWLTSNSLDPWELPIVEDYKVERVQTWGSGLENIDGKREIKDIDGKREIKENNEIENYNMHYVVGSLGVSEDSIHKAPRFKRNPKNGDIAVYKVENRNNELVEKYAIVEGSRVDSLLISEGVKGDLGLHAIYRTVNLESLPKYEFISIEKVKELESAQVNHENKELKD